MGTEILSEADESTSGPAQVGWPAECRAAPSPGSCDAGDMDLEVSPALTIPASELDWRFSRSSGPGGQHVNTTDSRAKLSWNVAGSIVLSDAQRLQLTTRLGRACSSPGSSP